MRLDYLFDEGRRGKRGDHGWSRMKKEGRRERGPMPAKSGRVGRAKASEKISKLPDRARRK